MPLRDTRAPEGYRDDVSGELRHKVSKSEVEARAAKQSPPTRGDYIDTCASTACLATARPSAQRDDIYPPAAAGRIRTTSFSSTGVSRPSKSRTLTLLTNK